MNGGVAQMVERSLSMREVRGSIPLSSSLFFSGMRSGVLLLLFLTAIVQGKLTGVVREEWTPTLHEDDSPCHEWKNRRVLFVVAHPDDETMFMVTNASACEV